MKILKRLVMPVFVGLLLTGCVEYNVQVTVNPDGTGTVKETVLFGKSIIDMLNAFAAWGGDDGEDIEIYNEDELRDQARTFGEGVKFVKGEELSEGGREGYTAHYKFSDITKIRIDQDPEAKIPSDMSSGDDEEEPITFNFNKGSYSTLTVNLPGEFDPEDFDTDIDNDDMKSEEAEELMDMLRDLRIDVKLKINGKINDTNASFVSGSDITLMRFDMGEIIDNPEQFEALKHRKPKNKEEMKELMDEIPGLEVELENPVTVKFK